MDKQSEIELVLQSHDIEILLKRSAAIHPDAIYGFLKSKDFTHTFIVKYIL